MEEPRSLSSEEQSALKSQLSAVFNTNNNTSNASVSVSTLTTLTEDMRDLMDYTLAMVMNGKSTEYIEQELTGMEMDICNQQKSHQIAVLLDHWFTTTSSTSSSSNGTSSNIVMESESNGKEPQQSNNNT
eukprot:705128_1